jgi:hypothetical protein
VRWSGSRPIAYGAAFACVAWCVTSVAFSARPTPALQFASLGALALFVVASGASFVTAVLGLRRRRWRALLPLAACVACPFVAAYASEQVVRVIFERSLSGYEVVVAGIDAGSRAPFQNHWRPQAEADIAGVDSVGAERTEEGVLLVQFDFGAGFPAKHTAHLYSSSGSIPTGSRMAKRWPFTRRLGDRWLLVSN